MCDIYAVADFQPAINIPKHANGVKMNPIEKSFEISDTRSLSLSLSFNQPHPFSLLPLYI